MVLMTVEGEKVEGERRECKMREGRFEALLSTGGTESGGVGV